MNHVGWMSPEPPKIPAARGVALGLLTACETQMLELLGAGLSSRMIAQQLGLSVGEVKSALMLLYRRLGVRLRERTPAAE